MGEMTRAHLITGRQRHCLARQYRGLVNVMGFNGSVPMASVALKRYLLG
jgi:hypothetical protein